MPRHPAIQLTIPQPCHEAWDQMTPAGAGRHCASCDKVVVDFTRMTDGEVAAWFAARVGQNACGRLRADQVGRVLLPAARPVQGWWRWAVATLAVLGSKAVVALPANAQTSQRPHNIKSASSSRLPKAPIEKMVLIRSVLRVAGAPQRTDSSAGSSSSVRSCEFRLVGSISVQVEGVNDSKKGHQRTYQNMMQGEGLPFPNTH